MDFSVGDRIITPDGKSFTIETFWNQGKHRVFKMVEGESLLDIHLNEGFRKDETAEEASPYTGHEREETVRIRRRSIIRGGEDREA